jgi:protein-L-isoaspartate O-methyltransferase
MSWSYDSMYIHRAMLLDRVRNEAFQRAIADAVRPGDAVLDVGTGTGILSLLAARADAGLVFAVEKTSIARMARRMVTHNGLAHRVRVVEGDIEAVWLPAKVDVIVSEWLGTIGVDENLLYPVLVARDRWLKPGGRMLPCRVTACMAPIAHRELDTDMTYLRGRPLDVDLEPIAEASSHEVMWPQGAIAASELLAPPQAMWTTDLARYPAASARLPFRAALRFTLASSGKLNAMAAWFHAEFGNGVVLTNAPGAPATHWKQYALPLRHPRAVEAGTSVDVEFTCIPDAPGFCQHAWSVRVAGAPWEHHDTRALTY